MNEKIINEDLDYIKVNYKRHKARYKASKVLNWEKIESKEFIFNGKVDDRCYYTLDISDRQYLIIIKYKGEDVRGNTIALRLLEWDFSFLKIYVISKNRVKYSDGVNKVLFKYKDK